MINSRLKLALVSATLFTLLVTQLTAAPIYDYNVRFHPVISKNGMVATQEALATKIGVDILKKGGNAIDAAVAVGFALAVTLPRAGNLGGGGFMLVHQARFDQTIALDYREVAPTTSQKDMFLNRNGDVDPSLSQKSILSSGVPGTVSGLLLALERYGSMTLEEVISPAIELAENGFPVTQDLYNSLKRAHEDLLKHPASKAIFLRPDGDLREVGTLFVQQDLAETLKRIRDLGKSGFYGGKTADLIVSYMKEKEGLISLKDLATYQPVIRTPVSGTYKSYKVVSMPPPSSGGIHLLQMLSYLEKINLKQFGHNTAKSIHIMVEAMKLAYADRSKYLGDPDFVSVPTQALLSTAYLKERSSQINLFKPTPSKDIVPGKIIIPYESNETTHFSIMDKYGNVVSNTYTLNFSYGNKQVVPGTGVLLNNEMDDFSSKSGIPNGYGLIGGSFNEIAGNKRMLSSMTPTIIFKNGIPFMVTGTPGGSRIITTVLQLILNVIEFDMNIAQATNANRIHHQWLPDILAIENGLNLDTIKLLKDMGYHVRVKPASGSTQSIVFKNGVFLGATDPRKPNSLVSGY